MTHVLCFSASNYLIIRINYRVILYKLKNDKINIDKYKTRRSGLYASILNHKPSKRM